MPNLLGLVTLLAAASVAYAQEPAAALQPTLQLTLAEAQSRALANSHRLAEITARQTAASAAADARAAGGRPTVAAVAGYTRTGHVEEFSFPGPTGPRVVYPDVPDNYQTRLDLQWPIYSGGRTDALERAARAEAAALGADAEAAKADLRFEVARAYWALVTSRASVGVLQQALARSETHIRDVRSRFDAGLVAPNETASADAQAARARMLLIEARNQRDSAAAELARLVGADPQTAIEPVATLEPAAAPAFNAGGLTAEARSGRAERQAMERRIEGADAQRDAAESARRPAVSILGGVDYARPNPRVFPRAERWDDFWEAGVRVNWMLWDGGRTAAETAQAASLAAAARERLAEFDAVLAVDIRQRTLDIQSGSAAVEAADAAIRAAEEAHRVVTERYRAGVVPQGDVLDAQLALLQTQLDRTRALAGVRLAEARLTRSLGR
jgi:outer membrane protein